MERIKTSHYPIVGSGIDWLSLRTSELEVASAYQAIAYPIFAERKAAGDKVETTVRGGFAGQSVQGLFFGHRDEKSILVLTSEVARACGLVALRAGGSVSRLDLQVTINTHPDCFNLASQSYFEGKLSPASSGRPRELMLTQTHPEGDTLNVNKRSTESYGRLYDFGVAHKAAGKHQVWRYEVEFKKSLAKRIGDTLAHADNVEALQEHLVYQWFFHRLPRVSFSPRHSSYTYDLGSDRKQRDVLAWFEKSLSVTVGRAIKDYGEARTLKALGLERFLNSDRREQR